MSRIEIRMDIIDLVNENPQENVNISSIIEKHTSGKSFEEQMNEREKISEVLEDMKREGDITFHRIEILTSRQMEFNHSSGMIRSTNKFEKEKKAPVNSLHIGGNVTGPINTGHVTGNLHQLNNVSTTITQNDEKELLSYGILQQEIDELKEIITKAKDRPSLIITGSKWLGGIVANVAAKGFVEHIPSVVEKVNLLLHNILIPF